MLILSGKLANVAEQTNRETGAMTYSLVLRVKVIDKLLNEEVVEAQKIKIIDEHIQQLDYYRKFIGKDVYVPVDISTMNNSFNVFYKTKDAGTFLELIAPTK